MQSVFIGEVTWYPATELQIQQIQGNKLEQVICIAIWKLSSWVVFY